MIQIEEYTTNFKIRLTTDHSINIVDEQPRWPVVIKEFLHKKITDYKFDPRTKQWHRNATYYYYNQKQDTLILPINYFDKLTKLLYDANLPYTVNKIYASMGSEIDIELDKQYTPKPLQQIAINHLIIPHNDRTGLQLATGLGKTFITINTICRLHKCAMILVAGLVDQWVREFKKFTNITDEDIYIVKGNVSLRKLFKLKTKPSIFICSLRTIYNYINYGDNYTDLPTYSEFIEYFGIGIKVIDEVHLNFKTTTQIELHTDMIKKNIYLTATYDSNNNSTKRIFDTIYDDRVRFGKEHLNNHTLTYMYGYTSFVPVKYTNRMRGYSHIAFEKWLLMRPSYLQSFFENTLLPLINIHYIHIKKDKEKCLIWFATIAMINAFIYWVNHSELSYLKNTTYVGDDSDDVLFDNELIASTHKNSGVGTDIKSLRTCINTVSFKSTTGVIQLHGRLRADDSIFVDIYAKNNGSHVRHKQVRERIYRLRSRQYYNRQL